MTRKRKKTIKALLLLCFLCLACTAEAQKTFKYAAKVGAVDTPGFYSITLQPALVAKSKADLGDIRLMDDSGHFVPYVLVDAKFLGFIDRPVYFSLPVVNKRTTSDTGTTFIVKDTCTTPIDNLIINLTNTTVERTLNLYGSDDLKQWYAIKENVPLQQAASTEDAYGQGISFPPINYHYLKLQVNDRHKAAIRFLGASTYLEFLLPPQYSELPAAKFVKRDSGKATFITINLADSYRVNKITLGVKSPRFYNRNVFVFDAQGNGRKLLATQVVRSGDDAGLVVNAKTNRLLLEIDNEDNPSLSVFQVKLFQNTQLAFTYLEAGKAYQLLTGDTGAKAPSYDLKFFTDSAKNHALRITHERMVKNELYVAPVSTPDRAKEHTIIIWAAILVALLLLSLLTWKMAGEVNKRGKTDA